ncbi:phage terminase large subunit family protein [Paraburkholderia pallida]|uniref:Phage terminase large subunit family protein n=1 Tax=Paraburkholderia pallida TaxID=2547399 RepID=A0A4P7CSU2_9BURK|nr:phage terminase large subunit family protein [Paraburkholderia pallida]QBQ98177.1 phage terminase large subunit family protein [Paraburkholderia pallida]
MGAIDQFVRTLVEAIRPDERLGIAEWSERHRILPETAPEPGRWRNSRTPYLVGIMDALSGLPSAVTRYTHDDHRLFDNAWVRVVGMQKGHQLGGSALGESFVGRSITSAAGNILAVFATKDDAEKWELDRFEPMRLSTPELRRRVRDSGKKGSDNTKLRKRFPGGMLNLVSASRAGRLKSTTVRYVLLEEIDEYDMNVDGQGNPIDLAENRTSNYGRRAKIFANSTPTIEGRSQIAKLYARGDQRRYFVPCPDCGFPQFFEWKNMRWTEGVPESVRYYCCECGVGNPEHAWKTRGYENAYWMPTAAGDGKTASFHLSALYAPIGWRPWIDLVRDWIAAQTDVEKLIAFVNNALAECWKDKTAEVAWESIKRRAEPFALRTIPRGVLAMTAAVDTQNDRLEVTIMGWGRHLTRWTIDHVVIKGDPATPEPWNALDRLRETPLTNSFGVPMRIELMAVDSGGGRTQDVYDYCRTRRHLGVFAVKGASEKHKPIIGRPTQQDVTIRGMTHKHGVQLWPVGTDTAKSRIFANLLGDEDAEPIDRRIRFSEGLDDEYFQQVVSEAYNAAKDRWDKLRPRNEALDCMVYNLACAYHPRLRLNLMTEADWLAREAVFEPRVQDLFHQPAETVSSEAVAGQAEDTVASDVNGAVSAEEPVATASVASEVREAEVLPARRAWITPRRNWFNR